MELMTDRVVFYYIFFASMIILVTMLWGLTKYKKLTNFQKNNRNNFVIKQGIILVILVSFLYFVSPQSIVSKIIIEAKNM